MRTWHQIVRVFLVSFVAILSGTYGFLLLIDPYGLLTPLRDHDLQYGNQRTLYPQIVRSKRFDSFVVGTSTSRLINPDLLNKALGAKFANLAMNSMLAWEQWQMLQLVSREVNAPKFVVIGLDVVWCARDAGKHRFLKEGFPEWLYDDARWNDFLNLLNVPTLKLAGRRVLYLLGLVKPHVRADGFGVFVPPDSEYDVPKASHVIWEGIDRRSHLEKTTKTLSDEDRHRLNFPALAWLDDGLGGLAAANKILVFAPVHIAAQPSPGSEAESIEAECKSRVLAIAKRHNATVIDWRLASDLTRNDENYWDRLHSRLPVADRVTNEIANVVQSRRTDAGLYRVYRP